MGRFETRVQFKQSKFSTVFLRSFYFAFAVSAVHFWYRTSPSRFCIQLVFEPIHGQLGRGPISSGLGGYTSWRDYAIHKL